MINLLIVGYSTIVKRKALKGIKEIPLLNKVDLVSVSRAELARENALINGKIFTDYDEAFRQTDANVAYISTVNSLHANLARKALENGLHVIVDKPSFINEEDTIELCKLARKKDLCLAEAIIYADHDQIKQALNVYKNSGSEPEKISSIFSFPPVKHISKYKYDPKLGGGALLDFAAYALTPGRVFFGTQPTRIISIVTHRDEDTAVETSFTMMAIYPDNKVISGHFGYESAYKSHLSLIGPKVSIDIPLPFSPPADLENEIIVNEENNWSNIKCRRGDNFTLYFERVFKDIEQKTYHHHVDLLEEDFYATKMLIDSVKGKL